MSSNKTSVYFPSLNGLRFIAASMVIIQHYFTVFIIGDRINTYIYKPPVKFFANSGSNGVTLFFVLSGFLITYLLLTEYEVENKINIKDFYIRRLLRIWPLYFFTIVISLLYAYFTSTLSADFFLTKLILFLFFLPNIAIILYIPGGLPMQLWSVGVEEQFYLFWPWVIRIFHKRIKWVLISISVIFIALRFLLYSLNFTQEPFIFKGINVFPFLNTFISNFRIDCMAIGGGFAWLLFNKHRYLKVLYSKTAQLIILIIIVVFILLGLEIPIIHHTIYSLLFGVIILNVSSNQLSLFNLKHRLFEELGKISYGLYVFHPLMMSITEKYVRKFELSYTMELFLAFVISFSLTILVSYLSFRYLETPFLKLKHKFSKIISGNEAQQAN